MLEKLCNGCFTLTVTLGCVAEPTPLLAAPAPKGEGPKALCRNFYHYILSFYE